MARKEAKSKRLANGTITQRPMRRVHRHMPGWASGYLYRAATPEVLLSEGSVYINGSAGPSSRHYVLTPTRLLWAPFHCAHEQEPEVDGFRLNEVTFFDFDRQTHGYSPRHLRVLVGGRTLTPRVYRTGSLATLYAWQKRIFSHTCVGQWWRPEHKTCPRRAGDASAGRSDDCGCRTIRCGPRRCDGRRGRGRPRWSGCSLVAARSTCEPRQRTRPIPSPARAGHCRPRPTCMGARTGQTPIARGRRAGWPGFNVTILDGARD